MLKVDFRSLSNLKPLYILPDDNLVGEVIIPCLQIAKSYDCMTAFFHSAALREQAPGLADFIARPEGKMRLLASPYLTQEDQAAIRDGVTKSPEILIKRLEDLYGSAEISVSALLKHTLECLAYLIANDRIQIKLVLVKEGLFHPKVSIFSDGEDYIAVHGSNNLTRSGLTTNVEQVLVSRFWLGGEQEKVVCRLMQEFEDIWRGGKADYIRTYDVPQALKERIVRDYLPLKMPTPQDFWQACQHDSQSGQVIPNGLIVPQYVEHVSSKVFSIPPNLDYEEGDFAHQGQAIRAWEKADRRGILEMATGSGKTIASLIAARRLLDGVKHILLVIAVPYLPLVLQWAEEARRFGLQPVIPGNETGKASKLSRIRHVTRNLKMGISDIECVVITHDFLRDQELNAELGRYSGSAMLIADEVHNLGTSSFLETPPDNFEYRMGLSATPIRQYDQSGTEGLIDYFGNIVFRFTLKEAIGKCLVPYNYYVHPVELMPDELDEWLELNEKLKRVGWTFSEDLDSENGNLSVAVQRLLNRRRLILEQATNKISLLRQLLGRSDQHKITHTLVYASDKGRAQLNEVNRVLMEELKLRIHQVTQEETGKTNLTEELLKSFAQGSIQVLTAMRVLDEGIDIPEVSTAYILASTTVERQWVQRRGRVLRKCSRINKQLAYIHDFLVLPTRGFGSDHVGHDVMKILKGELTRIMEFAKLSNNAAAPDGALSTIRPIVDIYFK